MEWCPIERLGRGDNQSDIISSTLIYVYGYGSSNLITSSFREAVTWSQGLVPKRMIHLVRSAHDPRIEILRSSERKWQESGLWSLHERFCRHLAKVVSRVTVVYTFSTVVLAGQPERYCLLRVECFRVLVFQMIIFLYQRSMPVFILFQPLESISLLEFIIYVIQPGWAILH